jgi:hypothetical protein
LDFHGFPTDDVTIDRSEAGKEPTKRKVTIFVIQLAYSSSLTISMRRAIATEVVPEKSTAGDTPRSEQNPICQKCEGADKGKPMIGLAVINGMGQESDEYNGAPSSSGKTARSYRSR